MANCATCGNLLTGKQTRFCCRKCRNTDINFKHKVYENQKDKGLKNKIKLLDMKGKYCQKCGYNKNTAALCFHHTRDKLFGIDIRKCSNTSWKKLVEETNKCIVLCQNCHVEEHNPQFMVRSSGVEPETGGL